jgi:acyl-CoA thioester hydrolase
MEPLLGKHDIRIYYEDTDLGGIVYHSRYLNFCERARSELFFARGSQPVEGEYHFVIKHIEADFKRPAKFADELVVQTRFIDKRSASFRLRQQVRDRSGDVLYFDMVAELVCLKGERVAAIPEGMLDPLFVNLEEGR